MTKPSRDPSVHDEPHLRGEPLRADPSEARVERRRREAPSRLPSEDQRVEHTVWDEPGLSPTLVGAPPAGDLTYRTWLEKRRSETSVLRTWAVAAGVALLAGPWAVVGAFLGSGQTLFSIVALVVFGPVVEETMKVAAALYVIEKRPFLFRSAAQIALCVLTGAFVFSALENVLYLKVYIPGPPASLVRWRWSVCVAMHMSCSAIVGLGLMRTWRDVWARMAPPRLTLLYPYMFAAIALHGFYNGLALILARGLYRF